jgi:VanZ family protein
LTSVNELISKIRPWIELPIFWYAILVLYLVVLLFLSLNPWILPPSTESIFSPDKLDHAVAYGGLVILTYFCISRSAHKFKNNPKLIWSIAIVIAVSTGILIEIAQSKLTSNRTGSMEDALANAIGALIGLVAFAAVKCMLRKKSLR